MSTFQDDYLRLTQTGGYVVLSDWTILSVRGADRAAFLHNVCTNDVAKLKPGQGCEAFFTDVKGHVLAHTIVLCGPDEFLLWGVPGQAPRLSAHLERYIIREDVDVRDLTREARLTVLSGEACQTAIADRRSAAIDQPLAHAALTDPEVIVARCPWFGDGAILSQSSGGVLELLEMLLQREGAASCDRAALEALRIECGTPYFGVDFDASNLPQEVNRNDAAISFTKGCYLGQETVARIDALGHVNKLLVRVRFQADEIPLAGTAVLAGEEDVGKITSAAWSPRLDAPLALAMIRRGHEAPGTKLDSPVGTAEVIET